MNSPSPAPIPSSILIVGASRGPGYAMGAEFDDGRGAYAAPDGTDLFSVTVLLVAGAARGAEFRVGLAADPSTGSGSLARLSTANAGLILADPSAACPGGGLDFINVVAGFVRAN